MKSSINIAEQPAEAEATAGRLTDGGDRSARTRSSDSLWRVE